VMPPPAWIVRPPSVVRVSLSSFSVWLFCSPSPR
jgi:hypothetical protein